jgi:hypothetical protein
VCPHVGVPGGAPALSQKGRLLALQCTACSCMIRISAVRKASRLVTHAICSACYHSCGCTCLVLMLSQPFTFLATFILSNPSQTQQMHIGAMAIAADRQTDADEYMDTQVYAISAPKERDIDNSSPPDMVRERCSVLNCPVFSTSGPRLQCVAISGTGFLMLTPHESYHLSKNTWNYGCCACALWGKECKVV